MEVWNLSVMGGKAQSLHKHVRCTRAMPSPYMYVIMSKQYYKGMYMYIGQVHIKRPVVDTAWYPAHIFEHGYQLISAARRHMVIMRTWPLHTVHCTCVACGARSVLGHVASLTAVAVPRARDSVHVREAYYKLKERRDTKQNSKQKLLFHFKIFKTYIILLSF